MTNARSSHNAKTSHAKPGRVKAGHPKTSHDATAHHEEPPLTPRQRLVLVVLPPVGLVVAYLVARLLFGGTIANQMAVAAGASMFIGTSVIFGSAMIGGSGGESIGPFHLALVALLIDAAVTLVFLGVADSIHRVPWFGRWMKRARSRARENAREHPWIRHWAAAGVALFVMVPLPASGVLGGVLVGQLVGLTRRAMFWTVIAADAVVCSVYAWGSGALGEWMARRNWGVPTRIALILGSVAVVLLLLRIVTGGSKRPAAASK